MNRYNNTENVAAVLLADAAWHTVHPGTFELNAYSFQDPAGRNSPVSARWVINDSNIHDGLPVAGYAFQTDDGTTIYGPLSTLVAVRTAPTAADTRPPERAAVSA